jgi:GT2 family glycosyltransferase/sugar lactone lactonase YvrE
MMSGDSTRRDRPVLVTGKFLEVAGARFLVKGVAYGTFAPDAAGVQFPSITRVAEDFALIAAAGINTVRTYTVPPEPVMDAAADAGLRVMVGMPWSQHVAFLSDRAVTGEIRRDAVETVKRLSGHPAALLFAVGNEIPPAIVRWHGEDRVTGFLRDLYHEVKDGAPDSLLTYVNFPPTEYLDLDVFDVCAFNVYLHRQRDLHAYLARLQHIAGYKPLLLAEAGADSIREGLDGQAAITAMHVRAAFAEGACGAVAFSWTDEWWRGGQSVDDWAFGLVDRDRQPKPALAAVAEAFADAPFPSEERAEWPRVSVVVCAYNAADTLDECLRALASQNYPDYEVIVVNDGSRDATGEIARRFPVRLIEVPNGGLSAARNLGLTAATGAVVAYTDADVRVEPDWLQYLVQPMLGGGCDGSGGPNVVPPDDPWIAQCVARAPGGPTHVLLDDRVAEHVPGCNMAFRREALLAVGGFNPTYLRAGDDVDVCWRLQAKGYRIGFSPSALVWHHHRASVKAYWRQQVGYGEGETWLDAHHPEKFIGGQMLWRGRIYSPLPFIRSLSGRRINTGVWGSAAFPSIYRTDPHSAQFLPHTPAWMVTSLMACISGVLLTPYPALGWVLLLTGLAGWATTAGRCVQFARHTELSGLPGVNGRSARASRFQYRALIAWLHFIQPIARLYGRVRGMWSPPAPASSEHVSRIPWKAPLPLLRHVVGSTRLLIGGQSERQFWSEAWLDSSLILTDVSGVLRASRPAPLIEVDDGWRADRDLSLDVGGWGRLHVRALVEEHAQGRCLLRIGARLRLSFGGAVKSLLLIAALVGATSAAVVLRWPSVREVMTVVVAALLVRVVWQAARAFALLDRALARSAVAINLTSMGRDASPWITRQSWWPISHAPVAQVAIVLALVVSAALSLTSLVERARAHLPFGSDAVVAAVPFGPPAVLSGSVAIGATGDVVFADATAGVISRLRVRLPGATVPTDDYFSVLANSSPAANASVTFRDASDVALAPNGDLYVADARNHRICRIDRATGKVITIAGDGSAGFDGDGGQAAQAALDSPAALAVARNGDLYIADTGNNRVRMLSAATGIITTVAGGGDADQDSLGDGGQALQARLDQPSGLAMAPGGILFVADTGHQLVRRVDLGNGVISTVAGNRRGETAGDGDPAINAELSSPMGLATVTAGTATTLFVADQGSDSVRVIGADGAISTLTSGKRFVGPTRLAYHPVGWLIVKDASVERLTAIRIPAHSAVNRVKGTPEKQKARRRT